jgi:hypothetical protein
MTKRHPVGGGHLAATPGVAGQVEAGVVVEEAGASSGVGGRADVVLGGPVEPVATSLPSWVTSAATTSWRSLTAAWAL